MRSTRGSIRYLAGCSSEASGLGFRIALATHFRRDRPAAGCTPIRGVSCRRRRRRLRGRSRRTRWLHSCALLSVAGVTPPSPQTLTRHEGRPATPQQLPHARWVAGRYNAGASRRLLRSLPGAAGRLWARPSPPKAQGWRAFVCRRRFGRARTGYLWCVAVARPLPKSGPTGTCGSGGAPWPRSTRQLLLTSGPPGGAARPVGGRDVGTAALVCASERVMCYSLGTFGQETDGRSGCSWGSPRRQRHSAPGQVTVGRGAVVFGAGTGAAGVTRPSPPALTKHGPSRHPLPTPPAVGGGTSSPAGRPTSAAPSPPKALGGGALS